MEWVETTGRTVEEAKDEALDRLGVDEHDAEFEVLEEPKTGLFGRLRAEARVRARVRPSKPRPKVDRRDRRRGRGEERGAPVAATTDGAEGDPGARGEPSPPSGRSRRRGGSGRAPAGEGGPSSVNEQEAVMDEGGEAGLGLAEQGEVAEQFLDGLLDAFGAEAEMRSQVSDDDAVEISVHGGDLGLLIGPRGQTLQAIQELCRTVVQRRTGVGAARVRVDIGGYRERRRAALERFATDLAEQVRATGAAKRLEPMNPADRKIVHDAVNRVEGVATTSEGEEPYRRVVIVPAGDR